VVAKRNVPRDPLVWPGVLVVAAGIVVGGCGGSGGGPRACTRGVSSACSCTNGLSGAQFCAADGSGFGACACAVAGQGSAGHAASVDASDSGTPAADDGGLGGGDAVSPKADANPIDLGIPADASVPDGNVSTSPTDAGYSGRLVTVKIIDAVIAPGKKDGTDWDDLGTVDPAVAQAVSEALVGPTPLADVLAALANPALAAVDKPDPYGSAQLTVYGMTTEQVPLETRDGAIPNTFMPTWPRAWHYQNLPIDTDVRIGIDLWDKDLVDDDSIGHAELNSNDLKAALAAQKTLEVQVSDQTSDQLLFIGISVVEQLGPLP